jgi:hypothetical protein
MNSHTRLPQARRQFFGSGHSLDSVHLGTLKSKFQEEGVSGLKLKLMFGQNRHHFVDMGVSPLDVAVLETSMKEKGWI